MWVLLVWLVVLAGMALELNGGGVDRALGRFLSAWVIFVGGIATHFIGDWLLKETYLASWEPEAMAFAICGCVLLVVGAVLVPVRLVQLLRERK